VSPQIGGAIKAVAGVVERPDALGRAGAGSRDVPPGMCSHCGNAVLFNAGSAVA